MGKSSTEIELEKNWGLVGPVSPIDEDVLQERSPVQWGQVVLLKNISSNDGDEISGKKEIGILEILFRFYFFMWRRWTEKGKGGWSSGDTIFEKSLLFLL